MICFRCPHCEAPNRVPDQAAAARIYCQCCYQAIQVPAARPWHELGTAEAPVRVRGMRPEPLSRFWPGGDYSR
jgi:hypothetical protein